MCRGVLVRLVAHCVLATLSLLPSLASAAWATYRGELEPQSIAQPGSIPVVLTIDFVGTRILGNATTSKPLPGAGLVDGERTVTHCRLKTELGNGTVMNLRGYCDDRTFDGTFNIKFRAGNIWQGRFKLTRSVDPLRTPAAAPDASGKPAAQEDVAPRATSSVTKTDCIRRKHACLVGCPLGDPSAEALCTDRCKRRFEACAAKAH
jgi:hypothetical protein